MLFCFMHVWKKTTYVQGHGSTVIDNHYMTSPYFTFQKNRMETKHESLDDGFPC